MGLTSYTFLVVGLDQGYPDTGTRPVNKSASKLFQTLNLEHKGNLLVLRRDGEAFVGMDKTHTGLARDSLLELVLPTAVYYLLRDLLASCSCSNPSTFITEDEPRFTRKPATSLPIVSLLRDVLSH